MEMSPSRRRRANWIANGLCSACGQTRPSTGKKCDSCKDKSKSYYHKRTAKMICPCGVTLVKGKRCDTCLDASKKLHYDLIVDVINHYGGKCVCCGVSEMWFLTIDHINNDGAEHARLIGRGSALYRWLKRNNYPIGFRVLCANCNYGRARNNEVCPHDHIVCRGVLPAHTRSRNKATKESIAAYGGKCVWCGEDQQLFLELDHIDGGGNDHRHTLQTTLAVWAKRNGFPDTLRILCSNCNLKRERPYLQAMIDVNHRPQTANRMKS